MNIHIKAFGIAKDIFQQKKMELQLDEGNSIGMLKSTLIEKYPELEKLSSLKFAVNEDYQEDEFQLSENDEVVIIPPVSGG